MINTKELYSELLSNETLHNFVADDNIFNGYPGDIEVFPCIVVIDENQNDSEYADNKHMADNCSVELHIFTKKLDGYFTTSQISVIIANIMNGDLWNCSMNGEITDPRPNVEHRVMRFNKSIFNN